MRLHDAPSFAMLVVGCGGGISEHNLSAYLIRSSKQSWSECAFIEGGSGVGAIAALLETHSDAFADFDLSPDATAGENAQAILRSVQSYLITHAHLDHVAGLILSAGSSQGVKRIIGTRPTLANLQSVFDGGLWPELASWDAARDAVPYQYEAIHPKQDSVEICPGVSATALPLSHGSCKNGKQYESTAFFISAELSTAEFLFFGDFGPDSVSKLSLNREVWKQAAPKIAAGRLSAVFMECSYCASRPADLLYGHLSPPYVFEELSVLAGLVLEQGVRASKRSTRSQALKGSLTGLNVCIIHIKDNVGVTIERELRELEARAQLGINLIIVQQGQRIEL